ncbi:MAG: glycosyltransferase family 39 protein [Gammaproteobacteria bacterium]
MTRPPHNWSASRIAVYAMAAVFAMFAYLSLVNLDWALFWDDEATSAFLARNWVNLGAPLVDDGRNVFTFRGGGVDIAEDGTFRYPQMLIALHALSFLLFGFGEVQVRILSALFSLAGMALFALVLRHEFPRRPGMRAVAFALACFAPITLGYARAATYNGLVLFLHMLVFWSYLQFCAKRQAGYVALALAAAVLAFHAHALSNLAFIAALGVFHMLFRRGRFDRRAWVIAAIGAGAYALHLIGYYFVEYASGAYGSRPLSVAYAKYHFLKYATMLNDNGILAWSIAVWFVVWRGLVWRRTRAPAQQHASRAERRRAQRRARGGKARVDHARAWAELRDDCALHHLALVAAGTAILAVVSLRIGADVRYMSYLAPFGAVVSAAAVCWAWDKARAAGVALFLALALSNAAAWPFLRSVEYGERAGWTLPALAVEYHREYHAGQRESLEFLLAHTRQDDLVYFDWHNAGWLLYYLSDRLRVCCVLTPGAPPPGALDTAGRPHLFGEGPESEESGDPDWLLYYRKPPQQEEFTLRSGGPVYRHAKSFVGWYFPSQRPEPMWHVSFPQKALTEERRLRYGQSVVRFYRRQESRQ